MKKKFVYAALSGMAMMLTSTLALAAEAAAPAAPVAAGGDYTKAIVVAISIFSAAMVMAAGTLCTALGMGHGLNGAVNAVGRNPEAQGKIMTTMMVGLAMIESLAIYALVIALVVIYANPLLKSSAPKKLQRFFAVGCTACHHEKRRRRKHSTNQKFPLLFFIPRSSMVWSVKPSFPPAGASAPTSSPWPAGYVAAFAASACRCALFRPPQCPSVFFRCGPAGCGVPESGSAPGIFPADISRKDRSADARERRRKRSC